MSASEVPAKLAGACGQVRPAGPADAVGGVLARFVAAPATTQEASSVLRAAAELDLAVVPRGAGTRLDWGAAPSRCDLIVETRLLDAVLEHAAGDLVVRAQAGVRLGQLAEVLAGAGQRLALDPPALGQSEAGEAGQGGGASAAGGAGAGSGGTVGGLVATGVAGPLRLRYGAPRDLLIGITIVRADGAIARAGGKVVKNVAGYDLGKLLAGSYGTLGLITEATFRLHPRPAAAAYVSLRCTDPAAAADAALSAAASTLAPSAVELDWPGGGAPLGVTVLLEGDAAGVAERSALMRDLLARPAAPVPRLSAAPPAWWGRGPAAGAGTVLQLGFWAGRLAAVLAAVRDAAAQTGLDPAVGGPAGAGLLHAALPGDAPPEAVTRFVSGLRAALADVTSPDRGAPGTAGLAGPGSQPRPAGPRGSVVVLHAPPAVRAVADLWGPVPAAALMRAIKDQFDPEHRMAPGRLPGEA